MVQGYETLVESIFNAQAERKGRDAWQRPMRPACHASTFDGSVRDGSTRGVTVPDRSELPMPRLPTAEFVEYHAPQTLTKH